MTKGSRNGHKQGQSRNPGIFFTVSNPSKLHPASNSLLSLLSPLCKSSATDDDAILSNALENSTELNVSDIIARELSTLKSNSRQVTYSGELCRGIGYITTKKPIVPSQLISSLFTSHLPQVPPLFVTRVLPADWVCAPNLKSFLAVIVPLISSEFKLFTTDVTWKVALEKHGLSDISKDEVIKVLHEQIDPRHEVSIHEPEITVVIQVTTQLCGVSLVKEFDKFESFNLRKFILASKQENP